MVLVRTAQLRIFKSWRIPKIYVLNMKTKLLFAIILISSLLFILSSGSAQDDQKIFYLHLIIYKNDSVDFKEFSTIYGTPSIFPDQPIEENYTVRVLSKENKILFKGYLEISYVAHPMPPEGQPEVDVYFNESEQYIRLPYFEQASKIQIFHIDKLIFKYDVPVKSTTTTQPPTGPQPLNIQLIVYVIILIGAVIGLVFLILHRRNRAPVQSPQNLPYRSPY